MNKPSKKKTASRKKADRLFDAPNLELAAMLLASGLLLFIGRTLSMNLDEGVILVAQIYSVLGLGLFVLSAISFRRKQLPELSLIHI